MMQSMAKDSKRLIINFIPNKLHMHVSTFPHKPKDHVAFMLMRKQAQKSTEDLNSQNSDEGVKINLHPFVTL